MDSQISLITRNTLDEWLRWIAKFDDNSTPEEGKFKCLQDVMEHIDPILSHSGYSTFLENAIPAFVKYLQESEPEFIQETTRHQCRKLIIEIIHRLPSNEPLRPHVRNIVSAMFKTVEIDNEENVVNCLRVIIELHKQFRPPLTGETQQFLNFIKTVFKDIQGKLDKIFEHKVALKVKDSLDATIKPLLEEIFAVTPFQIQGEKTKNLIPKASNSLKVLQELPIIVVLMYQIYKQNVQNEVAEFIPVIITAISLHPTDAQRASPLFNKEILVEFMSAQVKTLSFLAYIVKLYQDVVLQHSNLLVIGFINLLKFCPPEVSCLRRELYIAARHILNTELRYKFVPYMEKMLDDDLIVGKGWTVNETMRPMAYSTLADLTHHVRQHLCLADLIRAVLFFSCQVHDESITLGIQTMSTKLIFNLVDSIRHKSEQDGSVVGRDVLLRMLEVLVYKFKTVSLVHLPYYYEKFNKEVSAGITAKRPSSDAFESTTLSTSSTDDFLSGRSSLSGSDNSNSLGSSAKEDWKRFGSPVSAIQSFVLSESRTLVKTLVCAVKTITWGVHNSKTPGMEAPTTSKPYSPREIEIYIDLMKWGLKALEIYAVTAPQVSPNGSVTLVPQRPINPHGVRSKEEKEVLDHFGSVFQNLNPYTFRELFTVCIDTFVERTGENPAVQLLANNLLASVNTSPIFATILVEFLLERMEVMGEDTERSALYLKLFKLVFGSVSLFPSENEQMLRPYLRDIVNKAMEFARSAKDPFNYFLLLRALFRSIGGGSHDLLYQEFLPLLPNLLQGLNSLQSGLHRQQMKDLFVELCLTVPVRLSSLLPYLPQLMDPLVSALNGSPPLVSQGLRTLELCVDNLQPEFLYEHIQPVRADLMQALWKIMRTPHEGSPMVAFRILGKFGGSNRKMLVEPQKLEYHDKSSPGQCLMLQFMDHKTPIALPIDKVVEIAVKTLRAGNSFPNGPANIDLYYKKQSWDFLKGFVLASMTRESDRFITNKLILHGKMSDGNTVGGASIQAQVDEKCRDVLVNALTGWIIATTVKEIKKDVYVSLTQILRHLGMIMTAQQVGPFADKVVNAQMDPYVIFDALFNALACEEKDLRRPVVFALSVIMNCVIHTVHSKERAFTLPMIDYITDKMCGLCYERAWYAKMGGCEAISFFLENASLRWVLVNHLHILKALLFVFIDLTGEVSAGSIDVAKENLTKLIKLACSPVMDENLYSLKAKCLDTLALEFAKRLTSPTNHVREQCMQGLELIAELQGKSVSAVMEPHRDVLVDMIPPRKHLIRHQSIQYQLGILDGNAFCLSLRPKLFSLDWNVPEHKVFIQELIALGEADETNLTKLPCYKLAPSVVPPRKAVMSVLACLAEVPTQRNKIIGIFLRHLNSSNAEIQKHAYECLRKFTESDPISMEVQSAAIRPVLQQLTSFRTVTISLLSQLSYLYQLFPHVIPDKVWESLIQILRKFLEVAVVQFTKQPQRSGVHELKLCVAIVDCFHLLQANAQRFIEPLCKLCLQGEKALSLSKGSPLRKPLMKFLLRHAEDYINCVLSPPHIMQAEWTRFFIYFIQQKEADSLRQCLMNNPSRLITWMNIAKHPTVSLHTQGVTTNYQLSAEEQEDIQFLAVKTMMVLSTYDEDWILGVGQNRGEVVNALRQLWISPSYQYRCSTKYISQGKQNRDLHETALTADPTVGLETTSPTNEELVAKLRIQHWKEPFMVVKLLLSYYRKNNTDYEMLFQLLYAFCGRPLLHYHFFRDFLNNTLTRYSIAWKRQTFFEFRRVYKDPKFNEDVKAKIIQFVLIPCFAYCFERGQGDELIGSLPSPDNENPENIVNVLINEIIPQQAEEKISDPARISLSQLCCLFLDQAPFHIHDNLSKKQGEKLKKLVTFAWPTLLSKSCIDSCVKYYGHLILSHIAAMFNINKRIVLQVFHSLLKASVQEARPVVRQALDIVTPALPNKMEDGTTMLIHWTKKLLLEEGYSMSQLTHLLQLIVRHWKVYYSVRHGLISHMIHAVNRLSFTPSSSMDHRKLAVDIAEVIVKWELERMKNEGTAEDSTTQSSGSSGGSLTHEAKRMRRMSGNVVKLPQMMEEIQSSANKALDPTHVDSVLNFLMKMACHVNEPNPTIGSPGEALSKRCVSLIKLVLKPDVWQEHLNNMKLAWMEKILSSFDTTQVNYPNICTALDLLTFIIGIMSKEIVLENMKILQKGIVSCMTCQNSKVIRAVHNLMSQLMSLFPSEFPGGTTTTSTVPKYDELDPLYTCVSKVVYEGLNTYEKMSTASPQSLLGALMMLKAACANNPSYIDRIIATFMKCLQKLAREHLTASTSSADAAIATDLLTSSLDLVKNRVGVMGVEMRKGFIGTVLCSLIDKSTDTKVMQTIIKMLEEWMKNKNPVVVNQGPSIREKSILLVKMMQNVEKRFPTDQELIAMFLDLINFIYRDDQLKATELNSKLEPAFLSGLRCSQPAIREKFFQVFDGSIKRRLYERLLYILCSQNWEAMGAHYWIKQCEELLFATVLSTELELTPKEALIPTVSQGFSILEPDAKDVFTRLDPDVTCEPKDHEAPFIQPLERDIDWLMSADETDETAIQDAVTKLEDAFIKEGWAEPSHAYANVKIILNKEKEFSSVVKTLNVLSLIKPMVQLCHLDTHLAETTWISFFPRAWKILSEKQQLALANETGPFLCSGVHVLQQHCSPSALNTFVEATCQCVPAIPLKPSLIYYLGKTHNLWHRMTLLLEQLAFDSCPTPFIKTKKEPTGGSGDCYEFEPTTAGPPTASTTAAMLPEVLDSLSELYSQLREDDLWAGLWQKRAKYQETTIAIAFEQQGYYEKAQGAYELAMGKARSDFANASPTTSQIGEMKLWEEHWLKCAKELNQWDIIQEYSASKAGSNSFIVLESAWRNGSWAAAKEALSNVELGCARENAWKLQLIRGYVAVCSNEEQNLNLVERYVDGAQTLCIKEWRRLPALVSNAHVGVLQATQQVVELQEGTLIHQALLANRANALHEMKSVVKTWRNRLPCISDDLSHWSDIFSWRTHHYQFIANHFSEQQSTLHNEQGSNQTMLGVHASAQVQIHNFSVHQYCQGNSTKDIVGKQPRKAPEKTTDPLKKKRVTVTNRDIEAICENVEEQLEITLEEDLNNICMKNYEKEVYELELELIEDTKVMWGKSIHEVLNSTPSFSGESGVGLNIGNNFDIFSRPHAVDNFIPFASKTETAEFLKLNSKAHAEAICHFGKIARKHSLVGVAHDTLSKIYAIPSVPIVDCFQKIKQQVKCYIQQSQILGRNELQEALEIVESTNLKYFAKEMTAEFFSLKGLLLSQIGRSDEANKAFSASCQLHDTLAKSWGHWGDYLEHCFTRDPRQMHVGISAVTAFMHACRHQNEAKSRKYVAKILWLLMYDDEKGTLSDAVDKYCVGVPPIQWLPWVPQLLSSLVRNDGKMVINVLNQVGRMYPQAVYFPIRTLYLTLKIEQREKVRNAELAASAALQQQAAGGISSASGGMSQSTSGCNTPVGAGGSDGLSLSSGDMTSASSTGENTPNAGTPSNPSGSQPEAQAIKATPSMWRCSRIMHMQRDCHPTVLSSLEGIVDQLIYFRENWHEELLKQLKIGLVKCYGIAFENRNSVADATMTQQVQNFVRKLVHTFGINSQQVAAAGTDSILRRQQANDPGFQLLKSQFTIDFDNSTSALKLHTLIQKLRKWIKILESKTKTLSRTLLYEDRSKFLLSFNMQIAEIELPGEFLIPKHAHYYVKIARFQPKIDVIVKHQFTARRMYIRGHNGKVYPYLVVNDSVVSDARREERVLQLIRMLNHYLGRQKVTSRRNMRFTVPKLVAVSPQIRLIEDNPASLSLLEVFKLYCGKRQLEYDSAVLRYYEKLASIQMRGGQFTHHVLREILREIQATLVPRTIMKDWAWNNFVTPSDYWMFRKIFTTQVCLSGFAEYAFHLTRLNPEMMNLHQDSGMVNISYFKFDIDDTTGDLDSNRPVPFRLTPNISEFLTPHGVNGPVVCGMISLARCLVYPNYKLQAILRAVLRDEMISYIKKKQDDREVICALSGQRLESTSHESESETVINMVNKAVNGIMARLTSLSSFDGTESKVSTLVAAANSTDNLCRMDPTWLPWL